MIQRTARALRVYDRNNAIIHQFMDRAISGLEKLHAQVPELVLTVREDRLRFDRDPVLINPDRQEGLPFILYRNAFRRLTFVQGMTRPELLELLSAIMTDFTNFDAAGEDLLSTLWRLQLPHLRYFTLDALSVSGAATGEKLKMEQQEVDRLQGDIDGLVARIYNQKEVDDADLVKGVSITQDDLEALKSIRAEGVEDLDALDVATQRAITNVAPEEIQKLQTALASEDHDHLIERLLDVLFNLLFREDTSEGALKTIELIQQLFDSLLLSNRLSHMTRLVVRLHEIEHTAEELKTVHVARHLLRLVSSEARIAHVVALLSDAKQSVPAHDVVDFLRAVGASVCNPVLGQLDSLSSAGHRRLLLDLVVELGGVEGRVLQERMQRSQWFVVLELLALAQKLSREDLAPILLWAVEHEHAKVRAQALAMLKIFPTGVADELIGKAVGDVDTEVRQVALRLAAARRSAAARAPIEAALKTDEMWDRDARELRALMMAFAILFKDGAVPLLERTLNPGFFARSKMTNAQLAAAMALGRLGTPAAREALTHGQRTLNAKVRDAVRAALAREQDAEMAAILKDSEPPPPDLKDRPSDMAISDDLRVANDPLEVARTRSRRPDDPKSVLIPATKTPGRTSLDSQGTVRKPFNQPDLIPEKVNRIALDSHLPSPPAESAPTIVAGTPLVPPQPKSWTHSGAAVSAERLPGTRPFPSEAATVVERAPVPSAPPGLADDLALGAGGSWATPSPFSGPPTPGPASAPPPQPAIPPGQPTPPWGQPPGAPPAPPAAGQWNQPHPTGVEWSWGNQVPPSAPPWPQPAPSAPGWAPAPAWPAAAPQPPPHPQQGSHAWRDPSFHGQPTPMPGWAERSGHTPSWGAGSGAWQQGTPAGTPQPSWVEPSAVPGGTPAPWLEPSSASGWPAQAPTPHPQQWSDPNAPQSSPSHRPVGWPTQAPQPPQPPPPAQTAPLPAWGPSAGPAPSWALTQPMQTPPSTGHWAPLTPPAAPPNAGWPAQGPQAPAPPASVWPQQPPPQPGWPSQSVAPQPPPPGAWPSGGHSGSWPQHGALPPMQPPTNPGWAAPAPSTGWPGAPQPIPPTQSSPGAPGWPQPNPRPPGEPSWAHGASPPPPAAPPPASTSGELPSWASAPSGQWAMPGAYPSPVGPPGPAPVRPPEWPASTTPQGTPAHYAPTRIEQPPIDPKKGGDKGGSGR
ncbi:MAG: hypothetical protein U1E65_32140 [Myxococcota bacterium]